MLVILTVLSGLTHLQGLARKTVCEFGTLQEDLVRDGDVQVVLETMA